MEYTITIKGKEYGSGTFGECLGELMMIYGKFATMFDLNAHGVKMHRA